MADENLILVVATAPGFYDSIAREPGDQFRVPKKKSKASWFKAVKTEAKGPKVVRKRDPLDHDGDGRKGGDAAAAEPETEDEVGEGQPSEDLV